VSKRYEEGNEVTPREMQRKGVQKRVWGHLLPFLDREVRRGRIREREAERERE